MPPIISTIINFVLKKRFFTLILIIVLIIAGSFLLEYFLVKYIEVNWEKISGEKNEETKSHVQNLFERYQNDALLLINKIASDDVIIEAIKSRDRLSLFYKLKNYELKNSSIEIHDTYKQTIGWSRESGSNIQIDSFYINATSYVDQGLIYSWFILTQPIKVNNDSIIAYAVFKDLFDVKYPLSNRFISQEIFEGVFSRIINYPLTFDFSKNVVPSDDAQLITIALKNINQDVIGYTYKQIPIKSAFVDEASHNISLVRKFLLIVLVIIVAIPLIKTFRKHSNYFIKSFLVVILIWILRYIFLLLGFPSDFISIEIFNPKLFASSFGFGIVKSIGEMFITSILLLISVLYLYFDYSKYLKYSNDDKKSIKSIVIALVLALIFVLILRGYIAIIISAVYDSILNYTDPSNIVPSVEISVMFFNLFIISFSFVTIAVILFLLSSNLFGKSQTEKVKLFSTYLIFLFVSFLYGLIHPNPLTSQFIRFLLISGLMVVTFIVQNILIKKGEINKSLIIIGTLSIFLLVSFLYIKISEKRESQLQLYANEIARPIDNWLTFILDESLNQFSDQQTAEFLAKNDELKELAFQRWTKTLLSREGFNCDIIIFNQRSEIVSSFSIGSKINVNQEEFKLSKNRTISLVEEFTPTGTIKYYRGYVPIYSMDSLLVGGVRIRVGASRSELFQKEPQEILRKYTNRDFAGYYAEIYYSEFFAGKRIFSTNSEFANNFILPDTVYDLFNKSEKKYLLVNEQIDGKNYETVYVKSTEAKDLWLAVNAELKGFLWDALILIRFSILFLVMGGIIYFGYSLILLKFQKTKIIFDYRRKIFTAFLLVSIIPILLIGYYNKYFAVQRTFETIRQTLEEETSIINSQLNKFIKSKEVLDTYDFTDLDCMNISSITAVDFSLYINSELSASSVPELFDAGFINKRLSSGAYENIFLLGKQFFIENFSLGKFDYMIGYRAITDPSGNLVGVISVPTLHKQAFIEQELQQLNAYLFGVYAVIIILTIIFAIIFAGQISKPVRELSAATRKIAEGDFDYKIRTRRKDEFGKLEEAFNEMTDDIKKKREELVRYEKELAWKEMAKQVAHEIKNPLTPIKLAVQHLQRAYRDGVKDFDEILKQSGKMISEQIETLNRIATEFSNFARMPSRNLIVCNVNDLLSEAAHLFSQFSDLHFSYKFSSKELYVKADEEELRRAFVNIIRNAVQAMNEKGEIKITSEKIGNSVQIEIADTGPGIPEEVGKKIFEPNFSTKTDGMGLGLAIVKKTIDDLKGTISYTTQLNVGATFIITIPLHVK